MIQLCVRTHLDVPWKHCVSVGLPLFSRWIEFQKVGVCTCAGCACSPSSGNSAEIWQHSKKHSSAGITKHCSGERCDTHVYFAGKYANNCTYARESRLHSERKIANVHSTSNKYIYLRVLLLLPRNSEMMTSFSDKKIYLYERTVNKSL